jgi:trk system potassium uptake protein TrkH
VLLYLPVSYKNAADQDFINSLFTATSALCVTGLSVIDINSTFTYFGQIVILGLIQLGGLGYMTMATLGALIIGKVTLRDRMIIKEIIDLSSFEGLKALLKHTIKLTLFFEAVGIVIFTACFLKQYTFTKALYFGIFHSVSSFCNSGLALWSNSLEGFSQNYTVLLTTIFLIVSGGLGYLVLTELMSYAKNRKLSTHTKVVLSSTLILVLTGIIFIFIFEHGNPKTMEGFSFTKKIINSVFLSITPRTAGFNTVPTQSLNLITLFFILPLMFIGASPGGTGGGIKTTTFVLILSSIWSTLRGKRDTNLFKRRISFEAVQKALSIVFLGIITILFVTLLLLYFNNSGIIRTVFLATSAFGTVGLSTGLVPELSDLGKLIIIFTMFIGRLGTLTIGIATLQKADSVPYRYPEDKILLG